MSEQSSELKRCPFCGGKPAMMQDGEDYYVECDYCHARSYAFRDECNAEMVWNSRKIPEDLIAERWGRAERTLLYALRNAAFSVTEDKKYAPPPDPKYVKDMLGWQ